MPGFAWFALSIWAVGGVLCYLQLQRATAAEHQNLSKGFDLALATFWPVTLFFLKVRFRRWIAAQAGSSAEERP